jgi:hypothetical protein
MTKGEWSGWMQGIGSILAVLTAVALPLWLQHRAHQKARVGHLLTIATDVRIADRQAGVYLNSKYTLPAYRVPLYGARTALPALLGDGSLDSAQTTALVQWYVDATSFNYSLDLAQGLRNAGSDPRKELGRTRAKANHLVKGGKLSRFDEAIKALRKAGLPEESLHRIPLHVRVGNSDDEYDEEAGPLEPSR